MKAGVPDRTQSGLPSGKAEGPAMQAIWSGTISFSLVAIPVQLVKAVEPGRISFHLLHSKDYSPLERRMFCPGEDKIVPPEEIIRGYEIVPDKYIVVTDEELESVSPRRSRTIEIMEFIDIKEVEPVFFDHPYYLIPLKGGEKACQLLAEVMRMTNKAGIARFVMGEREHLVAVTSRGGTLTLLTLHYSREILSDADISPENRSVETEGKNRMKKSIRAMMADFNPQKYADGRRKKITALLKKKLKENMTVEAPEAEEEKGEGPADLMAALQESMRKVKKSR